MFAKHRNEANPLGRNYALCFRGRLSEELEETDANVFDVGPVRLSRPWSVWAARRRLKKHMQKFDVVVCHAMWSHMVFGPAIRKEGKPLVIWAHDAPVDLHWIDRIGMRVRPDLVIANSYYTKELWRLNFPKVPCQVGYYPLPEPDHAEPSKVRERVRIETETDNQTTVILIAARFESWKGHELLFNAISNFKERDDWVCWVAGGVQRDSERYMVAKLKEIARQNGISDRIRWLGSRSDVFDLMLAADIYCQPNLAPEPFGVAFIEAMHARLAIVSANTGGPKEFLDDSCGILIEQSDLEHLIQSLLCLLNDPLRRLRLGAAAKDRVEKMFSLETNIANLKRIFTKVRDGFRKKPQ